MSVVLLYPAEMETIRGYMVEVDWDGETLRARGTNKVSQVALRGPNADLGDVVLTRSEMASVDFKDASRMVNGQIKVTAATGEGYQLHFRRKQAEPFRWLARELGAA